MFALLACCLLLLGTADCAKPKFYKKVGDTVVLSPGHVAGPLNSITWKHGPDIASEWFGAQTTCYRQFTDRCMVNTSTGDLTITGVNGVHSGSYTAEINSKVTTTVEMLVISPVPTPTVSKRCDAEMTYCVLTCEGNSLDAEPISQMVKEPWLWCMLENPVSNETSERFLNPFVNAFPETSYRRHYSLIPPLVIGVICGFVLLYVFKCKKETCSQQKECISLNESTPLSHTNCQNPQNTGQGEAQSAIESTTTEAKPTAQHVEMEVVGNTHDVSQETSEEKRADEDRKKLDKRQSPGRKACWYGSACYRKNKDHFKYFSHPEDPDFVDNRPECHYGPDCSKETEHMKQFKHMKKPDGLI